MTIEELRIAVNDLEELKESNSNLPKTEELARKILAESTIVEHPPLLFTTLIILSESLWMRGNAHEALSFAIEAHALSESVVLNKEAKARAFGNLGRVHHELADYVLALDYTNKSLQIYEELTRKEGVAYVLSAIASIYRDMADYPKALEISYKSLSIKEELGDRQGESAELNNIGLIYFLLNDNEQALILYQQALAINEATGNKSWESNNYANMSQVFNSLGDYSKALEYAYKALAINEGLNNKRAVAALTGDIGSIYFSLSEYGKALEFQEKSLSLSTEIGSTMDIALSTANIGVVSAHESGETYNPEKAEEFLQRAVVMLQEVGAKESLLYVYNELSSFYKRENRWEECYLEFMKYYQLEKEIQSVEVIEQTKRLGVERKTAQRDKEIAVERAKHDATVDLLHNVLPPAITKRLLDKEKPIADKAESVSIFFSDIVGFTTLSQKMTANELVSGLNELFIQYDEIALKHGIEKIKTIGDAYMAVCGVPIQTEDHAIRVANFAVDILDIFNKGIEIAGYSLTVRIGLHTGEVVAGVIGENKFTYDLWGDAVNTASRMESHGEAGKIHVSEEFLKKLLMVKNEWLMEEADEFSSLTINNSPFTINHLPLTIIRRGEMDIKGKGMMKTYFLEKA